MNGFLLLRRLAAACALATLCFTALPALAQDNAPFQTTPGGAQYRDLQTGEGDAAALGDVAQIHVIGWLDENGARGRQIISSRGEGRPVSFVIGTERVMQGWNEAVIGMRPGGRRLVMIPPELAYGDRAIDDVIPARAFLTMIIELLSLEPRAE